MDEIEKRLREGSENCYNNYESWKKNQKDSAAREALQESIHELRKIASRLEIELAISERDEMAQRPIPIPPHRDAQRRGQSQDSDVDFNSQDDGGNYQQRGPRQHGGGGHHGGQGGQRRSLGRRSEGGGSGGGSNNGNIAGGGGD
jgi:hypothetical protein